MDAEGGGKSLTGQGSSDDAAVDLTAGDADCLTQADVAELLTSVEQAVSGP